LGWGFAWAKGGQLIKGRLVWRERGGLYSISRKCFSPSVREMVGFVEGNGGWFYKRGLKGRRKKRLKVPCV